MQSDPPDDQLLRSYLLGELSEEEAERIDEALLEDDESFLLCEAIEADLLAALARGELTPTEKEAVLARLAASARGRQRLALASFLNTAADRRVQPWTVIWNFTRRALGSLHPRMRWATMVAAVGLLVGAPWLAWEIQERDSAQQARHRISPPKVVLTLSLVTLRGADEIPKKLSVPPGTDLVVKVDLEGLEAAERFHATARSAEEKETVWEKRGLEPTQLEGSAALVFEIPAKSFTPGRYEVAVTAGTEELTADFEVRKNRSRVHQFACRLFGEAFDWRDCHGY